MSMIYHPNVTRRDASGAKFQTKVRTWWGRYYDPNTGLLKTVNLRTGDRSAALLKLNQIERTAAAGGDPFAQAVTKPLSGHLDDWEAMLGNRGVTANHVEHVVPRARAVVTAAGWTMVADIRQAGVWLYIGTLRDRGVKARTRGHYIRAVKQFTRWLVVEGRASTDPLFGLKPEPVTDETELGIFEPDELRTLLDKTGAGPVRRNMTAAARRLLYELAVSTGFRSNECRTLRWLDIDLGGDPPTATVTAKRAKNHVAYAQPLTDSLVAGLKAWRAQAGLVAPTAPVFPYTPAVDRIARMLREDMADAGLAVEDSAGRPRNFHSLRHTFGTNLARGGVNPRDAMALMRHSDINLTLRRYTHLVVRDAAAGIAKLPDLATKPAKRAVKARKG